VLADERTIILLSVLLGEVWEAAIVYHLSTQDLVGEAEYTTFQEQAHIDRP